MIRARVPAILLCILAGSAVRIQAFAGFARILPVNWLYVDENVYWSSTLLLEDGSLDRPPGTALLACILHPVGVTGARVFFSVLSLVPAILLAASGRGRWGAAVALAMAAEPSLALAGVQIMPEAPAAALCALAMVLLGRRSSFSSGLALGAAALFRPETALVLFLAPASGLGRRSLLVMAAGLLLPLAPAIAVDAAAGAGPLPAGNAAENLWLGSSPSLLSVPPGVEFEQLVSTGAGDGGDFLSRWRDALSQDPPGALSFYLRKLVATLSFPGPGRNLEAGAFYRETGLSALCPLTAAILAMALPLSLLRRATGTARLASAALAAMMISGMLFIPSERHRVVFLPFMCFLAAERAPGRRAVFAAAGAAFALAIFSLVPFDPVRPGLDSVLRAGAELDAGLPGEAASSLDEAEAAGFRGADIANLRGVAAGLSNRPQRAVAEFEMALSQAPGSPSIWRNYAVALYGAGRRGEAGTAARRAVALRHDLTDELEFLLR